MPIKIILYLIIFALLCILILVVARFFINERFVKSGIRAFGKIISANPTGYILLGIPQIMVTLSYTIDDKEYQGVAFMYTKRVYIPEMTVRVAVNPKNLNECCILSGK